MDGNYINPSSRELNDYLNSPEIEDKCQLCEDYYNVTIEDLFIENLEIFCKTCKKQIKWKNQ